MSEDERKAIIDKELIMLDTKEMCNVLQCCPTKLYQIIGQDKTFPVIKVGRKNMCYLTALQEWLKKRQILRGI